MANLIPDLERDTYVSALQDIHDTMARPITVWKSSTEVITSLDQQFDAFSDQPPTTQRIYTTEKKDIQARIKYIDKQDKEFSIILGNFAMDLTQEFQLVRIKVDNAGKDYLQDAEKITIDGVDFYLLTIGRPHGLFNNDFFTFYLKSRP